MASYPALMTASTSPVVAAAQRLSGHSGAATTVSFGTEAGLYAQAGIPTVVCGPGDIARAHKADEWIGLDELAASDRMMQRLASQLDRPVEEWITQ
jgi:acetylornithine deacetylase